MDQQEDPSSTDGTQAVAKGMPNDVEDAEEEVQMNDYEDYEQYEQYEQYDDDETMVPEDGGWDDPPDTAFVLVNQANGEVLIASHVD